MVGRKTEGNLTSFAASVIQQVSSPLDQSSNELSSDILEIMAENIVVNTMPSHEVAPVPILSPTESCTSSSKYDHVESCASSSKYNNVSSCPLRSRSHTPSDLSKAQSRS